jgi:hypothetical protein
MFITYDIWRVLDSQTAGEFNVLQTEFDSDMKRQIGSKKIFKNESHEKTLG